MSDKPMQIFEDKPERQVVQWTQEKINVLKSQIMPPETSNEELELFLMVCKRTNLDPFARQIYPIKRWDNNKKKEVIGYQSSIDGFRVVAERNGQYAGQLGPFWCGPDGKWTDVWLSPTPPAAARIGVMRHDFKEPLWAVAKYTEYVQRKRDGSVVKMWHDMPANQLAKCAEALAMRRAFPNDLSGIYTSDEMGQADNPKEKDPEPKSRRNAVEEAKEQLGIKDKPEAEPEGEVIDAEYTVTEEGEKVNTETGEVVDEASKPTENDGYFKRVTVRTDKMDAMIHTGELNVNRPASRELLVDILRARGLNDEEIKNNFKEHVKGKYGADQWTKLKPEHKDAVINDAKTGEIDEPIGF